jgi:hypothetical protein
VIGEDLYKKGHNGIKQLCIPIKQGKQLLEDIHGIVDGHQAAPRSLMGNAFLQGFYWPTMVSDTHHVVRTCEGCQYYARQTHLPVQALQSILVTWSFVV